MDKVAIIGRSIHPDGKETADLIARSLRPYLNEYKLESQFVKLKDILFDISNEGVKVIDTRSGMTLDDFAAVFMTNWFSHASIRKDIGYSLGIYMKDKRIPFMNTEAVYSRSTSKLSQMMLAAQQGVAIPRTLFCLNLDALKAYAATEGMTAPFIFKDAQASRGNGNYLLGTFDEIDAHRGEHSEKTPFMIQSMIHNDKSDYRLFMVDGRVSLIIKRSGQGDSHLNNTSAGATTTLVSVEDFDKIAIEIAEKMSLVLHREMTGVDIIFDNNTGQPYFLEANTVPQIATGSNVEKKLASLARGLHEIAERKGKTA